MAERSTGQILFRHKWQQMSTCFICEKCGETWLDTAPPAMGCPVSDYDVQREPYERPQVTRIRLDDAMMASVCKGRPHTPNTCWRRPAPPLRGPRLVKKVDHMTSCATLTCALMGGFATGWWFGRSADSATRRR